MIKKWILFIVVCNFGVICAQPSIDGVLKKYNDQSVPYVYPENLFNKKNVLFLDAREKKEFNVSHIKNSIYVGYNNFDAIEFKKHQIAKDTRLVIYCSLGVRSEKIAKKIKNLGYTNVSNLYGGIFLWKDKNGIIVDTLGQYTENIHAYSKEWGQYVKTGVKIYN